MSDFDGHFWKTWRGRFRYYGKLIQTIGCEPDLPDIEMSFTLHGFGGDMGYTCASFTRRGLARRMRKAEREAGVT